MVYHFYEVKKRQKCFKKKNVWHYENCSCKVEADMDLEQGRGWLRWGVLGDGDCHMGAGCWGFVVAVFLFSPCMDIAQHRFYVSGKDRGTRDQIASIHWIIKKAREFQKNIYFCFIDYAKVFDCVDHNKLWKILKDGNTRPCDLPLEKPICRSGSNS